MNPKEIALISGLVLITLLGVYLTFRPAHRPDPVTRAAQSIKPGATKEELIEVVGPPTGEADGWLHFSPGSTGFHIRARISTAGKVEAIDYGNGKVIDSTAK